MPGSSNSGTANIGTAALVVSAGILASRVLGYVRNLAIAVLLGYSEDFSLYVNAFAIPDYLTFLMAGGYLSITLVPLLSRHLVDGDEAEARRVFTAVLRAVGLGFALLAVVTVAAADQIVAVVFPRVADQAQLASLTRIALASQVFFGLGTLLMAAQYARRSFTIPSLAPLIYNLAIIGGGLLGWLVDEPSPGWFLWGGLVGAAAGNFGLQWYGARRHGFRLVRGVPWRHPALRRYFTLAFPLMVGLSAVALDEQWPRLFGQFAPGRGVEAALTTARQLNMLPVGVIAQAAGVAAYPFLAELASQGRRAALGATVARSVRTSVAVGALAAGVLAGLTLPVVTLAYGYGKVTSDDLARLAVLLFWFSLSIPFWAAHQVYTRGFYAMSRMWVPVLVGSAVTALTVPVLFATTDAFGAPGVAAGSTFGVALYTLAIAAAWHRLVSPSDAVAVARSVLRAVLSAAATAAVGFGLATTLDRLGLPSLLRLVVVGPIAVAVFLILARLTGLEEIDEAVARVTRPVGRRLRGLRAALSRS